MARYRIFPDNLTSKKSELLDAQPLNYVKYLIGFACAKNEGFNVVTTQMRFLKTEPWQIISSNIPSSGGQVVLELGYFNPGQTLSVFWVVRAVTKIASLSVYIINDQTKVVRKIAPSGAPKKMERGEDWGDEKIDIILF
ncbi:hypothetical protein ACFOWM_05525 [Ferruginibacter yonginensis]|uniref:Uncharacterized protein n=1 Tax=Ferruginibacter yonginensis TaxID=1310416 RepID=A0ABV8QPX2_9BACT